MPANASTFKWSGDEYANKVLVGIAAEFRELLKPMRRNIRKAISRPSAKRKAYLRVPSRPGQPPGVVTGTLRKSISGTVRRDNRRKTIVLKIRSRDRKAHLLELGTVKMRPRPFLRPELDKNRREFLDAVRRAIPK